MPSTFGTFRKRNFAAESFPPQQGFNGKFGVPDESVISFLYMIIFL